MRRESDYLLDIKTLPIGKHSFEYELDDSFFDKSEFSFKTLGCICAKLEASKQNAGTELNIKLTGKISVPCDRCLAEIPLSIDRELVMNLKSDKDGNLLNNDEYELDFDDGVLDLAPLFNEELLVSIPIRNVHDEGECDDKMLAIFEKYSNKRKETQKEEIDLRWAALKNISDNLKE